MANNSLPHGRKSRKSIYDMDLGEITAYNMELLAELKRLLTERAAAESPVNDDSVKVAKLPTKRMAKRVKNFDAMTDSEQVDELRAMW